MTTYAIRLDAILDNYKNDNDVLKLKRELGRLEIDATAALRRCDDEDKELEQFIETVNAYMDSIGSLFDDLNP